MGRSVMLKSLRSLKSLKTFITCRWINFALLHCVAQCSLNALHSTESKHSPATFIARFMFADTWSAIIIKVPNDFNVVKDFGSSLRD